MRMVFLNVLEALIQMMDIYEGKKAENCIGFFKSL